MVLKQATVEQSRTAENEMKQAHATFRSSQLMMHLKYLPETPPSKFAVEHYYASLRKIVYAEQSTNRNTEAPLLGVLGSGVASSEPMNDAAVSSPRASSSNLKRSGMSSEAIVSPIRRKKQCVNTTEPKVTSVVEVQVASKVGDACHFNGYLVSCDDEVRNISTKSLNTVLMEKVRS